MNHSPAPFNFDDFKKHRETDFYSKNMASPVRDRINQIAEGMAIEFGKTNNFPGGQITGNDEGEIKFGITAIEDRVIINFGETPVSWIGLTKEQAKEVAASLLKFSEQV